MNSRLPYLAICAWSAFRFWQDPAGGWVTTVIAALGACGVMWLMQRVTRRRPQG